MPDKGFQFRESIPDGTFPVIIRRFDRLTEAKAFAGTHTFVANPKETAGIVEQRMRSDATTVEQITEDKYSYSKYQSLPLQEKAMLEGTFQQRWKGI